MTLDERILACKESIVIAINSYNVPAACVMLMCDNIKYEAMAQIEKTKGEVTRDGNVSEENSVPDSEGLPLR